MSRPKPQRDIASEGTETELRIVGGRFRGRKLLYHGDPVTRPMKHRVREAIFNLVTSDVEGRHVFDLFAGTGALGLEALSRGAKFTTFIERHIPTARVVRENMERLEVEEQCELKEASAFVWVKRDLPKLQQDTEKGNPWLVFVSPPYAFFVDREQEMIDLITSVIDQSPIGSTVVVESDDRFDFNLLPGDIKLDRYSEGWDIRQYLPAVVGVWRKREEDSPTPS
jgi:16S rRNA (guanine966-N2)-methyltransferase